jgi:hypothetical protein
MHDARYHIDKLIKNQTHNEERFWLGGAAHERGGWASVVRAAPVSQKRVGLNRRAETAMGIVSARSWVNGRMDAGMAALGVAHWQSCRSAGSGWQALGAVHDVVFAGQRRPGKHKHCLGCALCLADRRCRRAGGDR